MTDQTIPADKVEKIAASMREAMRRDDPYYSDGAFLEDMSHYIRDLENLLPNPPRPTLADMTREERAACQWMQADVADHNKRYVIADPDDGDGEATLIAADGEIEWIFPECVTPRPDLRRMEWPSAKKPVPAPAPPNTLTEGSEWDNVDALARACEESGRDQIVVADKDGDVFVWGVDAEWWETGLPGCDYAPHTILHAGKKADQ